MSLFSDWVPPYFLFKFSEEVKVQVPRYAEVVDWSWDPPDRDKLVAYRRECPVISATTSFQPIVCPICGETLELLTSSEQFDGLWYWLKPITHYVQFHHVRVPERSTERIRANQYRPPVLGGSTEGDGTTGDRKAVTEG
jgi:hypothetical protein